MTGICSQSNNNREYDKGVVCELKLESHGRAAFEQIL